jgi:hypothetical protein
MPGQRNHTEVILPEIEYQLPSEYLIAEPPLSPAIAQWLAGKRQRRRTFLEGCRTSDHRFRRESYCLPGSYKGYRPVTLRGHYLDGSFASKYVNQDANMQ